MATRKAQKDTAKKTATKTVKKPASTAVAAYTPPPLPADATPLQQTLHAIIAATRDASISVDKMERMLDLQERLMAADAKREFDYQMSALQPALPVITKKGMITIRDKNDKDKIIQQTPFARFEDIQKSILPILSRFGFALTHRHGRTAEGLVFVTSVLSHATGHREETTISMQVEQSGSKNPVQGVGSSLSYGYRYNTKALLNLIYEGEDDDAQAAGGTPEPTTIDADQVKKLQALMAKNSHTLQRVLNYVNLNAKLNPPITMLTEVPATWFERTVQAMS